jgi:hypothetical protein
MFIRIIGFFLIIGAWSNAAANFIAFASNEITNITILVTDEEPNGVTLDASNLNSTPQLQVTSASTVDWLGNNLTRTDGSSAYCDPEGCGPSPDPIGENNFDNQADGFDNWSRGDVDYSSGDNTFVSKLSAVAEIQSAPDVNAPNISSFSSITANSTFELFLEDAATITISYDAEPHIEVWASSDDENGSFAEAGISFALTLTSDTFSLVDSFVEDSLSLCTANGESLNACLNAYPGDGGDIYNPGMLSFERTFNLAPGVYNLTLQLGAYAIGSQLTTVPEPTALALLSLGLVGLGFTRRRMKA